LKENLKYKSDEELYELMKMNPKLLKEAFDEIYLRYSAKLYTYCRKILNNDPIADDIYQETFTRFYESVQKAKTMTNVNGYLIKIARNLCLNEKEKMHVEKFNIEDFQIASYDKSYSNKQLMDLIDTTLELLPDSYKEVIIMKEYMNMTYNEIAEVLNLSMPIVRIRIYRAKTKMRDLLSPYLEEIRDF
jgi:RNA polymerase sigma-70 factor (ECF subfamily)